MHTPGPWKVDPNYADDVIAEDGSDVLTGFTPGGTGLKPMGERLANVRLAAAAPCLLSALREAEALIGKNVVPCPDKPDSPWGVLVRVRGAIAKAEGKAC